MSEAPDGVPTLVAVVSPKGGVGKTSIAANLAVALAQRQRPVLLVDLDPQNAARLHLQTPLHSSMGLSVQHLMGLNWNQAVFESPFQVSVLPYGIIGDADRQALERSIDGDADWLRRGLAAMELSGDTVIIVDTPPGASVYMRQALTAADFVLAVLLPDAASYATVPYMQRWVREYCKPRPGAGGAYYLVNRMNSARVLCRDVLAGISQMLGGSLIPRQVHFDAAVEEALASQLPVAAYAADSLAARDVGELADWLLERL